MSIATLPVACAASTWKMMPRSRHIAPIAGMSWITPISLLTNITEARILFARFLDRCFGFPSPGVAARRRVAEMFTQPRNHRVDDALVHRTGGAVVHVDREVGGHVHVGGGVCSMRRPDGAAVVFISRMRC